MPDITTQLDLKSLREQSLSSLYFFAKAVLKYDWINKDIHGPLCTFLQDESSKRKLIELPRGWLKSTLCSISFPIWLSIRNPNIRILLTQNSATNAQKKLSVIGKQWEGNELLRLLFPELLPGVNATWTADAKCLNRTAAHAEGTYEAAGTSTRVVSRHYDVIIEDDTVAPDFDELGGESLAPTHDEVLKAIGWHKTNVLPLMNNPSKDLSLVVGTRWYVNDLIAWVKENEPSYKIMSRAVRENAEGKPDPAGRVTYPERFDENTLMQLEQALGVYMYSCLYMNTPVRSDDMVFRPEWMKYYDTRPLNLAIYTTVDPATDPSLAATKNIDYNVVMTTGKDMHTGRIYVLDYFRKRCSPGELAAAIFDHVVRFKPIVVGYDNTSYQRSIAYWLKELMHQGGTHFIMEPLPRSGADAKRLAIQALQPLFANEAILLRPHMKELMSELLMWPLGGDHDDLADCLAMQLQLWKRTKLFRQEKALRAADPFLLETAMAEIRRDKIAGMCHNSLVFDPMRTGAAVGF